MSWRQDPPQCNATSKLALLWARGWTKWPPQATCNVNYSIILQSQVWPQWHGAQHELKITPWILRTYLCSCLRVSSVLLQQHLYQCPNWFQGSSGKTVWFAGTLLMGYRYTFTILLLAVLFTGFTLSISFQWYLENLWAVIDVGSIFSRGWLKWGLREKQVQKTLHHLHTLQLRVSYWSMEGDRGRTYACKCFC